MKKIFIGTAAVASAFLIGCADSGDYGQGSSATTESGASASSTAVSEPGVASESGNVGTQADNKSPETQFNSLGSASAPSANVPANVATNGTSAGQNTAEDQSGEPKAGAEVSSQNEQGAQATPEPNTGDDQNPDDVKPENE